MLQLWHRGRYCCVKQQAECCLFTSSIYLASTVKLLRFLLPSQLYEFWKRKTSSLYCSRKTFSSNSCCVVFHDWDLWCNRYSSSPKQLQSSRYGCYQADSPVEGQTLLIMIAVSFETGDWKAWCLFKLFFQCIPKFLLQVLFQLWLVACISLAC